jgi:putative tryptophan/tyrosine transport system substrate-binding protein
MRLIGLAVILAVSLVAAPLSAEAQQPGKIPRIGMLFLGSASTQGIRAQLIRDELAKLGYVEGQTIIFDVRFANGRLDRVSELATELVRSDVDVVVTSGSQLVQAIRPIARSIPIVVGVMSDPISAGFVASFARPGGNITGLAFQDADLGTKRLQLLTEVMPAMSRIALLFDPRGPDEATRKFAAVILRDTETAARALGLTAHVYRVGRVSDFENAFVSAKRARAQAVMQISSPLFAAHRQALVDLATKHQLPVACETSDSWCSAASCPMVRASTKCFGVQQRMWTNS